MNEHCVDFQHNTSFYFPIRLMDEWTRYLTVVTVTGARLGSSWKESLLGSEPCWNDVEFEFLEEWKDVITVARQNGMDESDLPWDDARASLEAVSMLRVAVTAEGLEAPSKLAPEWYGGGACLASLAWKRRGKAPCSKEPEGNKKNNQGSENRRGLKLI
ncbi:hypothetical protein K438DRAFT_1762015 [Mycena galopus ATCC 62051]|nr:hypothetical protein K438DRAFT_1762015 [Mycena galopus ATCC 62051]